MESLPKRLSKKVSYNPATEGVKLYWASKEVSVPRSMPVVDIRRGKVKHMKIRDYNSILFYGKGEYGLRIEKKWRLDDEETIQATFSIDCRISRLEDWDSIPHDSDSPFKKLVQFIHDKNGTGAVKTSDLKREINKKMGTKARDLLGSIESRESLFDNEARTQGLETSRDWIRKNIGRWGLELIGLGVSYRIGDRAMKARIERERTGSHAKAKLSAVWNVDWKKISEDEARTIEEEALSATKVRRIKARGTELGAKVEVSEGVQETKSAGEDKRKRRKMKRISDGIGTLVDELKVTPDKAADLSFKCEWEHDGKTHAEKFSIGPEMESRIEDGMHTHEEIDARIKAIESEQSKDLGDEDQVLAWAALGFLYANRSKSKKAMQYLNRSIQKSREILVDNPVALNRKMLILWGRGKNDLYYNPDDYESGMFEGAQEIERLLDELVDYGDRYGLTKFEDWEDRHEKILRFLAQDEEMGHQFKEKLENYE